MHNYKGTQTEENLRKAFAGESQTRSRYTFFANVARREGHEEIAKALELASDNEKEHARIWLNELGGIRNTAANLAEAVKGETYESEVMYLGFAEQARQDGFPTTAALFERIATIEKRHAETMRQLLDSLENKPASHQMPQSKRFMECRFCGNIESTTPDAPCDLCHHDHAFVK